MKRTRQEVVARWLASRAPEQRTVKKRRNSRMNAGRRGCACLPGLVHIMI